MKTRRKLRVCTLNLLDPNHCPQAEEDRKEAEGLYAMAAERGCGDAAYELYKMRSASMVRAGLGRGKRVGAPLEPSV